MARAHSLGGRGVFPAGWWLSTEHFGGMAASSGAGPLTRGTGCRALLVVPAHGGMVAPKGTGQMAGGTASPPQLVVVVYGALAGDGSPNGMGPLARGKGSPAKWALRCLWSVCGGMTTPYGACPLAGVTGSRALSAVAAQGVLLTDGIPIQRGPTDWGDGESCPIACSCLWSACCGW